MRYELKKGKDLESQRRRKRRYGVRKEIEVGVYTRYKGEKIRRPVGLAKRVHEEDH